MEIKKNPVFTSTDGLGQFNGFYYSLGAISSHTFSHSWLEMAPRERQKPFHFLHTSDGKQILIVILTTFLFRLGKNVTAA